METRGDGQKPETKERLAKIKSLMTAYATGVEELAKTQTNLLAQIDKRSEISAEWSKAIETQLASPALAKLDNRLEIEKLLHKADAKVNTCGPWSGGSAPPATTA